jgi:hypothetical protein
MRRFAFLFTICLVFLNLSAQSLFQDAEKATAGESQQPALKLNGFARGVVFGGGEKYELATTFAEVALQPQLRSHGAFLQADIRLRKGVFFNEDVQLIDFKELYAGYSNLKFDLLLGNQVVSWGRTDGFNPTDNITPKDYFLFTPDPDDQQLSNFLLRAKYRFTSAVELDVIGVPFYQPSVYKYDLFDMGANVSFAEQRLPEKKLKNSAVAARLNVDLPAAGWSVSYFRGYDPYHGFEVAAIDWSTGSPVITNRPASYLKTSWGADLAVPLGAVIVRAEGAYNITENPDEKMYIPMNDFSYVGALEANVGGLTVIAQYVGKYVPDFTALVLPELTEPLNPLAQMQYANAMIDYENRQFNRRIFHQQERMNHAVALSLTKSVGYDAWELMCTGYYDITSEEWMIQPKVTYKISDALTASLGGNYMHGSNKTLFGYASTIMNGAFISLKASF